MSKPLSTRIRILLLLFAVGCASEPSSDGCDGGMGPGYSDYGGSDYDWPESWLLDEFAGVGVDTTKWNVHGDSVSVIQGNLRIVGDGPWRNGVQSKDSFTWANSAGHVGVLGTILLPPEGIRTVGFVHLQLGWENGDSTSYFLEFRLNDQSIGDHHVYLGIVREGIQTRHDLLATLDSESEPNASIGWTLLFDDRGVVARCPEFWFAPKYGSAYWLADEGVPRSPFRFSMHAADGLFRVGDVRVYYYAPGSKIGCSSYVTPKHSIPLLHGWIVGTIRRPDGMPLDHAKLVPRGDRLDGFPVSSIPPTNCSTISQVYADSAGTYSIYYGARVRPWEVEDYELKFKVSDRYGTWLSRDIALPIGTTPSYEVPDTVVYDIDFTLADTVSISP